MQKSVVMSVGCYVLQLRMLLVSLQLRMLLVSLELSAGESYLLSGLEGRHPEVRAASAAKCITKVTLQKELIRDHLFQQVGQVCNLTSTVNPLASVAALFIFFYSTLMQCTKATQSKIRRTLPQEDVAVLVWVTGFPFPNSSLSPHVLPMSERATCGEGRYTTSE